MNEAVFIRRNIEKWRRMEMMEGDDVFTTPDEMVNAYNDITSDLAFAQTHYPDSPITTYLNDIALGLHRDLYRHKHTTARQMLRFWTHEIPLAVYDARKALLLSLVIFILSTLAGVVSTLGDPEFPRLILGNDYVNMTEENIRNGEPMAVYAQGPQLGSFLGITLNNVLISFKVYVYGLFTSFGSGLFLLFNGVMFGSFMMFFIGRGLLVQSFLAVMLHGTLELSAIVIAGGAGIMLGNGWLFPGTYGRLESFLRAGRRSIKVLVSTIPIFITAGFIEGYFTRFTHVGDLWRLMVILLSAVFVVFYYVILPVRRHRESTAYENLSV